VVLKFAEHVQENRVLDTEMNGVNEDQRKVLQSVDVRFLRSFRYQTVVVARPTVCFVKVPSVDVPAVMRQIA
jgi:hypothetical protein